jgi:hypothetical protein
VQHVSVIICSIEPRRFAAASASWQRSLAGVPCEIIGIHDARSLAEGYNRGLQRAQGDVLVFSHDDVDVVTPDVAQRLGTHLASFDVVGIAGTRRLIGGGWFFAGDPYDFMLLITPHPETGRPILQIEGAGSLVMDGMQALDGVFFAARAEVARALRFDAVTFDHFHLYDLDFSFRAYLAGYRLAVCRDLLLVHASNGSFDPRWDMYRLRFEAKFAGRLAAPVPRQEPRILNAPLDAALFADPVRRAELARPEALSALVARLEATAGSKQ